MSEIPEVEWGTPPGAFLKAMMANRGLTQAELAAKMGRPSSMISAIAVGKKRLTPRTALDLEGALGVPAEFWVDAEARYQLRLERERVADGEPDRFIPQDRRGWLNRRGGSP